MRGGQERREGAAKLSYLCKANFPLNGEGRLSCVCVRVRALNYLLFFFFSIV